MPLKEGSSDKVIQENIKCILDKEGCGYDPPYKDPSKDDYTPAQAAAIAYAKAGKRNNASRSETSSKKAKSVKDKGKKSKSSEGPKIPDGWRAKE